MKPLILLFSIAVATMIVGLEEISQGRYNYFKNMASYYENVRVLYIEAMEDGKINGFERVQIEWAIIEAESN